MVPVYNTLIKLSLEFGCHAYRLCKWEIYDYQAK